MSSLAPQFIQEMSGSPKNSEEPKSIQQLESTEIQKNAEDPQATEELKHTEGQENAEQ